MTFDRQTLAWAPLHLDPVWIEEVRWTLANARFDLEGIQERLGATEVHVAAEDVPRALRITAQGGPLDTLLRLFVLGRDVDAEAAAAAIAPADIDGWIKGGLLCREANMIRAALQLVPYNGLLICFDIPPTITKQQTPYDYVPGPDKAARRLLNTTVRRPLENVLDMGCGCGVQGLTCARHSKRVLAVDPNARGVNVTAFNAALNRVENIDVRQGHLFEPVAGERFDLITAAPAPAILPNRRSLHGDGRMARASSVEQIVRQCPQYLRDGGLLQVAAQWGNPKQQAWTRRLEDWFAGTGCDAWVIELENLDTETYAAHRISETEEFDRDGFVQRCEQWMEQFETNAIKAVSTGLINMRRRSAGDPWYWVNDDTDGIGEDGGAAILRGFALRDFLAGHGEKRELLEVPLRISQDARLEQQSQSCGQGWEIEKIVLGLNRGIRFSGHLDSFWAALLGQCDGRRPFGELVADMAAKVGAQPDSLVPAVLPVARGLVERGFLLPPNIE